MLNCWELEAEMRPTFSSLVHSLSTFLETMVDYVDIGAFAREKEDNTLTIDAEVFKSEDDGTVFKNDTFIELETITENHAE